MSVAETILSQLGGNRFAVMTGSKNFIGSEEQQTLTMKLVPNKSKAKYLTIQLTAMDGYNMTFYTVCRKTLDRKVKVEYKGIYCDQLQELFTEATGLYTTL